MRRADESGDPAPSIEAKRLHETWAALARTHVAAAGGCSCGPGAPHLRLEDFEQDILDYLHGTVAAQRDAELPRLLQDRAGYRAGRSGSLAALLTALAAETGLSPAQAQSRRKLLADLARSLDSFAQLHPGH